MKSKYEKWINILDKTGFVFLFIFAASLTTSIFVNQIGYFGALLTLLARFLVEKKFEKRKSGLELFFILLITAEIISAILSYNSAQAFHNTFKRAILIPVVYMPIYYLRNEKRFKRILYAFLVFAILGMLIYLFFAYRYYINQLYSKEAKGPSIFQYVMTAGGLMSIVSIVMVSFLFEKDLPLKYKILVLLGIFISIGSLISSYTRAAWIGTFAGIVFLFILNKRWTFILFSLIAIGIFFSLTQTISEIIYLNFDENTNTIKTISKTDTKGRVQNLSIKNNTIFLADYEAGIGIYKLNQQGFENLNYVKTPSPVKNIIKIDNFLFATLLDSRIFIYSIEDSSITFLTSIIPEHIISSLSAKDSLLFITEGEHGFSILNISNPQNPKVIKKLDLSTEERKIVFTSVIPYKNFLFAFLDEKRFLIFDISDLNTLHIINEITTEDKPNFATILNDSLIIIDGAKEIKIYDITQLDKIRLINSFRIQGVASALKILNKGFLYSDYYGSLYYLPFERNNKTIKLLSLKGRITGIIPFESNLIVSYFHRSRLSSIYDLYHPSNIERMNQFKVAFKIFSEHPLFGVGNIDFNELYKKYRSPYDKYTYGHFHNNYTHILATLGIFGFVIFISLLIKIFFIHLNTIKLVTNRNFYRVVANGFFASFIGICTSGFFEYNFGDHEIATMLWFTVGMNITIQRLMKDF